jgi:outer membrane protein
MGRFFEGPKSTYRNREMTHRNGRAWSALWGAVCLTLLAPHVRCEAASLDFWKTDRLVVPTPHEPWRPTGPLPDIPAPAQHETLSSTTPLSLPQLTEFALRNNPRTRQAWLAARAAAAGVGIERADSLPQISAAYAISRNRPVSATTGAESPWLTRFGPSISLSYVLYDFGVSDFQLESAEYRLLAANLTHNRVLQDVVLQVEQSYYQLLGLDALVRTNELSLKNNQTALEAVQKRRESGLATIADVYRVETQVAQAQLNLTRSQGDLEKSKGQLATAVGLPPSSAIRVQTLTEQPQIREMSDAMSALLDRAKKNRPDLVAAEAQARAARASANAVARAGLPSIEITGLAGHTSFNDDRASAVNYSVGINLRVPLFTGFRDTYARRQAEAQAAQAEAARDALYRATELEVWQAYYDLRTAATGIASTEAQVRSAEQTAQATLARYQAGFGSILDLITAQQDESNARVQRIQSYLGWFTALARLNFAVGMNDLWTAAGDRK